MTIPARAGVFQATEKVGEPLVSSMPFGLAAGLTPEQLADRLAYLRSL